MRFRCAESICRDLRALRIEFVRAKLEHVRDRLIPCGQLLLELQESGRVDRRGGWHRYCQSGKCQQETGVPGADPSLVYRFIKLVKFGFATFEGALRRAEQEQIDFDRKSGLDWALAVLSWDRGDPLPGRQARPSRASRESVCSSCMRPTGQPMSGWCGSFKK